MKIFKFLKKKIKFSFPKDNLMDPENRLPSFTKKDSLVKSVEKFQGDSVRLKCISDGKT